MRHSRIRTKIGHFLQNVSKQKAPFLSGAATLPPQRHPKDASGVLKSTISALACKIGSRTTGGEEWHSRIRIEISHFLQNVSKQKTPFLSGEATLPPQRHPKEAGGVL